MAGRPLRVLQVSARFLPQVGGVERHIYEVATRFRREGIDAEVLTTDATGSLPAAESVAGIPVQRVRAWPRGRDLHLAPGLYRPIRDGGWNVVHIQGIHTLVAPIGMDAASRAGIPYVVTFHSGGHSSAVRSRLRPVQWLALRPLLRRAARLVAVSRFERDHFARQLGLSRERFSVIPNGAEISADPTPVETSQVDPDLVVSVGRVERYKGHHRLVEALPCLLELRPNARLRIVGDGPDRRNLERRASELGVADRVEIGPIDTGDRSAMLSVLSRAGVVALLSEYEAHGIAVMEALSLGRPVVVATTTGLTELAERGWARGIPLRSDPWTIARALLAELDGPPRQLPDLPSWDDTAAELADVYQQVANGVDHEHQEVDDLGSVADAGASSPGSRVKT
jgi:glycosyltransferase involved in cell wall biosynthesis